MRGTDSEAFEKLFKRLPGAAGRCSLQVRLGQTRLVRRNGCNERHTKWKAAVRNASVELPGLQLGRLEDYCQLLGRVSEELGQFGRVSSKGSCLMRLMKVQMEDVLLFVPSGAERRRGGGKAQQINRHMYSIGANCEMSWATTTLDSRSVESVVTVDWPQLLVLNPDLDEFVLIAFEFFTEYDMLNNRVIHKSRHITVNFDKRLSTLISFIGERLSCRREQARLPHNRWKAGTCL